MKIKYITAFLIVIFAGISLYAEFVFLKNGTILEGKIVKENDRQMTLKLNDGSNQTLQRKDVLRVLMHDSYKKEKYFYTLDCAYLNGYLVDEDKENYIYRKELSLSKEYFIEKSKVDFITARKIPFKEGEVNYFDTWLIGLGFPYILPVGYDTELYKTELAPWGANGLEFLAMNPLDSFHHFAIGASIIASYKFADENRDEDDVEGKIFQVSAEYGLNYIVSSRIVIQPFIGAGYMSHSSSGLGVSLGLRLPVRVYEKNNIAPFVRYDRIILFEDAEYQIKNIVMAGVVVLF